jgi:1-pyrroline-5-carboxylate dehydrogenase
MPHKHAHILADYHKANPAQVDLAIKAAVDAQREWSRTPWHERAAVFLRAAELIAGPWRSTINAATMLNQSKTAFQAEIDAACEAIDFLRFNSDYLVRIYEEQPISSPGVWNRMEYRPLEGFVLAISPFNFTAIGANLTTSPALMGNTVVWKPASTQALSAWVTLRILEEAGLPTGVINLVFGSGSEIGPAALTSPELAGVHFTGSTGVFHSIWRTIGNDIQRYRNYPRIVGETGGKDFILAHPSADLDKATDGVYRSAFGNQGQKCSACSRTYVHRDARKAFLEMLVEKTKKIRIGNPLDRATYMGPVINASAVKTYEQAVEQAKRDGGRILVGGKRMTGDAYDHGYFVEPTIIDGLPKDHPLFFEELFVPILVVADIHDLDEAIDWSNRSEYGLTAGIFSEDADEVERFFDEIHAGVTYANRRAGATTGAWPGINPFVGWKASGLSGRGTGGPYYVQQFMREQSRVRMR